MRTVEERKRVKFLVVLPLLVAPFITMAFAALGGGEMPVKERLVEKQELNTELPEANPTKRPTDKLSYYNEAITDSIKRAEAMRADPYYQSMINQGNVNPYGGSGELQSNSGFSYKDPNETQVYDRINRLNATLNENNQSPQNQNPYATKSGTAELGNGEVERLENMMKMMQNGGEQDPEMKQLSGMLEKILDIQHPDRVQEKLKQQSALRKGQVFPVTTTDVTSPVSWLSNKDSGIGVNGSEGFYSLNMDQKDAVAQNSIKAVIHENQTLVSGAIVKLRLMNDVYVNGVRIPKDNFVFGVANLSGERLNIEIDNIRFKSSLFPVQLSVHDMDGLDGIFIPGAISRDAAKESGANVMEGLSMSSLDPSIGAQAASAGIELTKNLFGKKIKLVKVMVKAGYQVLLKDGNQKDENN